MRALGLAVLLWAAGPAAAQAPETSARPVARSDAAAACACPSRSLRPVVRPSALVAPARAVMRVKPLRPRARPADLPRRAPGTRAASAVGAICGDPALRGERLGPVPGRKPGCGIDRAVRLRSVAGVHLSRPAVVDCVTARALGNWVETGLRPAVDRIDGQAAALDVAAHYACRTRNGQSGAKVSEHGKGRAIDIAGIRLRDGREITVEDHWQRGRRGRALRRMHKAACGPFGTVLGPEADRWHRDHFHFDTARYRGGAYCR
ncbi:extensin-like domain-containing protein [Roseovarius salinarum]|uniref:extensin-like domain-containing protein n=1 Tax=Roseovarius salinarum TaxID=1981892 RepID=UPI000C344B20|nr:extensin family protein [Roseovarius salinarum]